MHFFTFLWVTIAQLDLDLDHHGHDFGKFTELGRDQRKGRDLHLQRLTLGREIGSTRRKIRLIV
jgi:hypothetical protein